VVERSPEVVMFGGKAVEPFARGPGEMRISLFGGLRLGELAGLQVGDFDPLRRQLRVRRTVSDVQGRLVEGPPKTPKSMRTVSLPEAVVDELTSHLGARPDVVATDWLFPAPEGGPLRRTGWVRRHWKPALRAAGLDDDLGTHTLRHSHVALLIAQGEHPKVIADRLGHTSVKTVLDVYGHLYEGADGDVADRLDKQIASYSHAERVPDRVVDLSDRQ
jgi:integrase